MALLREMVERGQVEMFGGGDMEPVLAVDPGARPHRPDHRAVRPPGAAARSAGRTAPGSPSASGKQRVVPALADAGIQYVTVDDYHFLCAGKSVAELAGYYTTEEDGRSARPVPDLRGAALPDPVRAGARDGRLHRAAWPSPATAAAAIYFDDIEKFGIWPETYDWVYEKKWLEQFIEGVLASPRIATAALRRLPQRASARAAWSICPPLRTSR